MTELFASVTGVGWGGQSAQCSIGLGRLHARACGRMRQLGRLRNQYRRAGVIARPIRAATMSNGRIFGRCVRFMAGLLFTCKLSCRKPPEPELLLPYRKRQPYEGVYLEALCSRQPIIAFRILC